MNYKLDTGLVLIPQDNKPFRGTITVETILPEITYMQAIIQNENFKLSSPLETIGDNVRQATFKLPLGFKEQRVDISVAVFNTEDWVYGPKLNTAVDVKVLQRTIKEADAFKELSLQLTELKFRLDAYAKGFVKPNLPPYNKEHLKKGMVLMTIDDEGNVAFLHPFYDVIKEVNGLKANDQKLTLKAKNIPYSESQSVEEAIKILVQQNKANADSNERIVKALEKIAKSLSDLEMKFIEQETRDII